MITNIINELSSEKSRLVSNAILWVVLLITAIAVIVPFSPIMPAGGLDPSWKFGMNQAMDQGLSIGRDIVFTFGPYSSIYTKLYHPSTDFLMVGGGLYLALSYWVCLAFLMSNVEWRWSLIFCALLSGLMVLLDPLFFSFPLLAGLATFKMCFLKDGGVVESKLAPLYVVLLFAPFGLLPLVKGSIIVLCCAISVLCAALFVVNKQRVLATICLVSPLVTMFFFWIVSGQPVGALPNYFIGMVPIISGYTEAMAVNGKISEVISYLIASMFLLLTICSQSKLSVSSKVFLFSLYFLFLFVSFKAGFVRHDGHAVIAGTSILMAALLLPFIFNSKSIFPVIVLAVLSWSHIDSNYRKTSTESIGMNIKSTYSSMWHGIENRINNKNWPSLEFDTAVNSLRKQASFPNLQGTTDIYSYNQSHLIASGNSWSPRPVFQSYSAYTPALVEMNRNHLLGSQAPDNIIFSVEPIDGRIPSIEDGVSWPILMTDYQPFRMESNFLFLRKKEKVEGAQEPLILTSGTYTFGKVVDLPHSNQPVFVRIEIESTVFGRIASVFFKPSQLRIALELKNGAKKQYRIIAGMAKSGFLVSPLIENTAEFGMLYGENEYLDAKHVKSISVEQDTSKINFWNDVYTVTFSEISAIPPADISKISETYQIDGFENELSGFKATTAEKCDGSIDVVNGMSPVHSVFSPPGFLRVNGWAAASVNKAVLLEAVYVVVTDQQGNHKYLRTRRTTRPDVGAYFKKPSLNESGYSTIADISSLLEGAYILGLAMKTSGTVKICPQFKIPLTIVK